VGSPEDVTSSTDDEVILLLSCVIHTNISPATNVGLALVSTSSSNSCHPERRKGGWVNAGAQSTKLIREVRIVFTY
jgi:hypothetical protein